MSASIDNPIINRPYDRPDRHWEFDQYGLITDQVATGRRKSEYWVPVPRPRKGRARAIQAELDLLETGERRRFNDQVNQIRDRVERWRQRDYPNVTPTTRRLLEYWADPSRDNKVLFCQREAVETAVYIAEAAAKESDEWIRNSLADHNLSHNDGLPRVAFKMATGSGKTVVMAMLIAWQTLNKVERTQDARFTRRFLIVTPGITIRERLRVLMPADENNYYKLRDLVPSDLMELLPKAEIVITNFHSFLLRTTKEGRGLATNTKVFLRADRPPGAPDVFTETPDQMVNRVLREFTGSRSSEIMVLNDEAHHCYRGRGLSGGTGLDEGATTEDDLSGDEKKDARARNDEARRWFAGLQAVARKTGIKTIYDLSATPFFLKGSGYPEGYLFPWVVSDFSLMDAIEAGIVKIPRVPVDDDASGDDVTYRHLWSKVGPELPKRVTRKAPVTAAQGLPGVLEGALRSLYGHYERSYRHWEKSGSNDTPPVFIVVCGNTAVSKLVYEYVGGYAKETPAGEVLVPGGLELFSNVDGDRWIPRPRTILVDSVQLESGESLRPDFRSVAAAEIEAFKHEFAVRTGRRVEELEDGDILREVMNTVGKQGRLGAGVRCVVSVSMLTEGWDANTVTHILGVRAFGSQLLCEQVVGRGLRRRSYAVNEDGYFEPEYAEVYGVPFSFIRTEADPKNLVPKRPPARVKEEEDRVHLRIHFPRLDGYREERRDAQLVAEFDESHRLPLELDIASRTESRGVVGEGATHDLAEYRAARTQQVAYKLAARMVERHYTDADGAGRPWLFPNLARIAREWLEDCVDYRPGSFPGLFLLDDRMDLAIDCMRSAIFPLGEGDRQIHPIFRRYEPTGSTEIVDFFTTREVYETDPKKCPVNYVVLDGMHGDGNTWEQIVAMTLEANPDVESYVKNDHLEFSIPYLLGGRTKQYRPDFLARLVRRKGDVERYLIVEVSGGFKTATLDGAAMSVVKRDTVNKLWLSAVNTHGAYGRWGFTEITDPADAAKDLEKAIGSHYADGAVTGWPI